MTTEPTAAKNAVSKDLMGLVILAKLDILSRVTEKMAEESIMTTNSERSVSIPAALSKVYQEMHLSPVELLKDYALSQIQARIQKYEAEASFFATKHESSFEAFRERIESMENQEEFEAEDDLMDWEFAVVSLDYWKEKAREIATG